MDQLLLQAIVMLLEANTTDDRLLQRQAAIHFDLMVHVAEVTLQA